MPESSREVTKDFQTSWTLFLEIVWANLKLTFRSTDSQRFSLVLVSSSSGCWPAVGAVADWLHLDNLGDGAVPPGPSSAEPAIVEALALHFKLDTFVTNSLGRCFFKSTHHIGVGGGRGEGGEEGGLGEDHHQGILDKGIILTVHHIYRDSSH